MNGVKILMIQLLHTFFSEISTLSFQGCENATAAPLKTGAARSKDGHFTPTKVLRFICTETTSPKIPTDKAHTLPMGTRSFFVQWSSSLGKAAGLRSQPTRLLDGF
ncbi:MAG: hypothetical protein LBU65_12810 [Planctomycetaceae bacterium]|jgi:hypothetical protein|nr:hypothetical protein [Planctomycetaceae bacterium]